MKWHKLYIVPMFLVALTGCQSELEQSVALDVSIIPNENVTTVGDTLVVKKGSPMVFNLVGDPDYLTFFSGERGHQYIYKDRDRVDPNDIESSKLKFSIWYQYGNATTATDLMHMYISDSFPGLLKSNFNADSVTVESHAWKDLVDPTALPQAPGTAAKAVSFEVDLASYLGSRFAIALKYQAKDNSASQPKVYIVDMKIVNTMKDGSTSTLYAGNFGLTPVNMMAHFNLDDQTSLSTNKEYGTVTNNTSGIWNLKDAATGNFFIHSSNTGKVLKYSWLVSDLIMANASSPDAGTAVKNITQRLDAYTYTYNQVGTYKATFLATNSNYKAESRTIRELNIKVVE